MIDEEKIMQAIFDTIDEVNGQLPSDRKINKTPDTALFANGGTLDSLGLVSLVTTLEEKMEDAFGLPVTILEEIEVLEDENPFETILTLQQYLKETILKKTHE